MKLFVSYSHRDEGALERLHVHLAPLRRDGLITEWFDRKILAGSEIDQEIASKLEDYDLFIAIVSPDFLNSNYCVEKEMKRAIERHNAHEARLIPLVVEPCDWLNTPLGKFKALPKDGNPVSNWLNENTAYLDVVNELRRIVSTISSREVEPSSFSEEPKEVAAPARYRVKKKFDDVDLTEFRLKSFDSIRGFFASSVEELDSVDGLRGRFSSYSDSAFGCVVVNQQNDNRSAHITIHCGGRAFRMADIFFSYSENAPSNTMNGGFSVQHDDYQLFLSPVMFMHHELPEKMTPLDAARATWSVFLEQVGVEFA